MDPIMAPPSCPTFPMQGSGWCWVYCSRTGEELDVGSAQMRVVGERQARKCTSLEGRDAGIGSHRTGHIECLLVISGISAS